MTTSVAELQRVLGTHYRVERELGAGGMATVYLAHDPKHDRRVAIKVLRPELAAIVGGERFLKEIRTTANLQHPHILPLHDSGDADGTIYYVMPYVQGESLRQRLQREKQLPVDEAIRIAREVASGLDYAHRHGVVHRDIKPENILLHDGQALVVDFGIALAVSRSDGGTRMTETGMSLGTPNYMSPEQAMGEREITPKSDVYALGCVLYEMLIGEPPFTGPTPQAIFARVLTDEPRALTVQRRTIPPYVEAAVLTSLSKLPADRFATAALFGEALTARAGTGALAPLAPQGVARTNVRRFAVPAIAAALLVGAVTLGRFLPRETPPAPPSRLTVMIPRQNPIVTAPVGVLALSPDGSTIIYAGEGARGQQLFQRRLDDLAVTPLVGTDAGANPIFSQDGRWIGFLTGTTMRKVPASGGSELAAGFPSTSLVTIWGDADRTYVSAEKGALGRLRSNGTIETIAMPASGEAALVPVDLLPDGRLLVIALEEGITGSVWIIDPADGERTLVSRTLAGHAAYQDGYVAWVQSTGALVGARWDDRRGELGPAQVIVPNVKILPGATPQIAFSRAGSLVYVEATPSELVRVDRGGRAEVLGDQQRRFHSPRVSPDGSRIAVDIADERRDVWLLQLRDTTFTRLSFDNDGHDPMWTPDGKSVLYGTSRAGNIGVRRRRADGSGESDSVLYYGPQLTAHTMTPDGSVGIGAALTQAGDFDLVRFGMAGGKTEPLLTTRFAEMFPAISPNGRWLAYGSDESGRAEVYVRPLNDAAGRILVSANGGVEPVWSRDGRELFYRDQTGPSLIAAAIETQPDLRVRSRTVLFPVSDFEAAAPHANYDVTRDGKFIFVRTSRATELVVIQNWPELLRRRSATP